jgi:hypothetical protein
MFEINKQVTEFRPTKKNRILLRKVKLFVCKELF